MNDDDGYNKAIVIVSGRCQDKRLRSCWKKSVNFAMGAKKSRCEGVVRYV
jgi:hypothetical protein